MNCLNCGNELPNDVKFCRVCGTPVAIQTNTSIKCIRCGEIEVNGSKFCGNCGQNLEHNYASNTNNDPSVNNYASNANNDPSVNNYASNTNNDPSTNNYGDNTNNLNPDFNSIETKIKDLFIKAKKLILSAKEPTLIFLKKLFKVIIRITKQIYSKIKIVCENFAKNRAAQKQAQQQAQQQNYQPAEQQAQQPNYQPAEQQAQQQNYQSAEQQAQQSNYQPNYQQAQQPNYQANYQKAQQPNYQANYQKAQQPNYQTTYQQRQREIYQKADNQTKILIMKQYNQLYSQHIKEYNYNVILNIFSFLSILLFVLFALCCVMPNFFTGTGLFDSASYSLWEAVSEYDTSGETFLYGLICWFTVLAPMFSYLAINRLIASFTTPSYIYKVSYIIYAILGFLGGFVFYIVSIYFFSEFASICTDITFSWLGTGYQLGYPSDLMRMIFIIHCISFPVGNVVLYIKANKIIKLFN